MSKMTALIRRGWRYGRGEAIDKVKMVYGYNDEHRPEVPVMGMKSKDAQRSSVNLLQIELSTSVLR